MMSTSRAGRAPCQLGADLVEEGRERVAAGEVGQAREVGAHGGAVGVLPAEGDVLAEEALVEGEPRQGVEHVGAPWAGRSLR